MSDEDLIDLARYAMQDYHRCHSGEMTAGDAKGSICELLAFLIDRDPTPKEVEEVME